MPIVKSYKEHGVEVLALEFSQADRVILIEAQRILRQMRKYRNAFPAAEEALHNLQIACGQIDSLGSGEKPDYSRFRLIEDAFRDQS